MSYNQPLSNVPVDVSCTVEDVAAIIRARTKDKTGNEVGTFNDDTRPTAEQCQEAIDHAVTFIHTAVGQVGTNCADVAKGVVAIGAAAEIELSYFPEQARSDRSIYTFLITRYDAALAGLADCVLGNLPGVGDNGGRRYGTFTCVSGVVNDYYTGVVFPPIKFPDAPEVQSLESEE
jgi:hypothetical protein